MNQFQSEVRSDDLKRTIGEADALLSLDASVGAISIQLSRVADTIQVRDANGSMLASVTRDRDTDSLSSAFREAMGVLNYESVWRNDAVFRNIVNEACRRFNHGEGRIFSSASFTSTLAESIQGKVSHADALRRLAEHPGIVRLSGGCHWYLLPESMTRFVG